MLVLPIKKKWFDMILSGEKKEEYREIKPYWEKRIKKQYQDIPYITLEFTLQRNKHYFGNKPIKVKFINGYSKSSPYFVANCHTYIRQGKTKWGAEPNKEYFVLDIKNILEKGNIK